MKSVRIVAAISIFCILFCFDFTHAGPSQFCTNWNTNIKFVCKLITFFHKLFLPRVSGKTLRHCDFLRKTPHCCEQFCIPANQSGTCEQETGVCRCKGIGKPEMCNIRFQPNVPGTKDIIFETCEERCAKTSTEECKSPAYAVDGYNFLCICYCE